jgi:putative peptide zinc metalloprotease protein
MSRMARFPLESRVRVRPFAHVREKDGVTIGDVDRQVFLAIPAEGLDILNWLAAGDTVGDTVRRYEQAYGETPDIDDFLGALAEEGFVDVDDRAVLSAVAPAVTGSGRGSSSPDADAASPAGTTAATALATAAATAPATVAAVAPEVGAGSRPAGLSMNWISPAVARRLCSTPVLLAGGLVIVAGFLLAFDDPDIIQGYKALLFLGGNFAELTWLTVAFTLVAIFIHELAHAVVARAAGVPARFMIGNLMYYVAFQTDVSGLWLAPRRLRLLAILAGSYVDLVFAFGLVGVLWLYRHGDISLSATVTVPVLSALITTYMMRVLLQFFFFLRTDLYYFVVVAFGYKNLMAETEHFLRNLVARVVRRPRWIVDQSAVPARERRAARAYAVVWLVGRAIALGALFFFYLPLLFSYVKEFVLLLATGHSRLRSADFLTIATLGIALYGGGVFLWLRGLYRNRRRPAMAGQP